MVKTEGVSQDNHSHSGFILAIINLKHFLFMISRTKLFKPQCSIITRQQILQRWSDRQQNGRNIIKSVFKYTNMATNMFTVYLPVMINFRFSDFGPLTYWSSTCFLKLKQSLSIHVVWKPTAWRLNICRFVLFVFLSQLYLYHSDHIPFFSTSWRSTEQSSTTKNI